MNKDSVEIETPDVKISVARKHGYYAKDLLPEEVEMFEDYYRLMRDTYPDLDYAVDDVLLIQFCKTAVMINRPMPDASPAEEDGTSKHKGVRRYEAFAYRIRVLEKLSDALSLNRRARKASEKATTFEKQMREMFEKFRKSDFSAGDKSHGRTKPKKAKSAEATENDGENATA